MITKMQNRPIKRVDKLLDKAESNGGNGLTPDEAEELLNHAEIIFEKTLDAAGSEGIDMTEVSKGDEDIIVSNVSRDDSYSWPISVVELAVYNEFIYNCMQNKTGIGNLNIKQYGKVGDVKRILFTGSMHHTQSYWFMGTFKDAKGKNHDVIVGTQTYINNSGRLVNFLNVSFKKMMSVTDIIVPLYKELRTNAFKQSIYAGKCIKINVMDGAFEGIEIVPMGDNVENDLILSDTQRRFLEHFEARVRRGNSVRYLLNGEPGTGKTESIRNLIKQLTPTSTFIIPVFRNKEDLMTILEASDVFENAVLVIDDIDLYLGSRDKGGVTSLLVDFLAFFDGVKKHKISLLASTNDKGLVDKAAERPGRFNMTIDFSYLGSTEVRKVVDKYFPSEWKIDEVYNFFETTDNVGQPKRITGAFIANLADNVIEMSKDSDDWGTEDTLQLMSDCYEGFYNSQLSKGKKIGFGK